MPPPLGSRGPSSRGCLPLALLAGYAVARAPGAVWAALVGAALLGWPSEAIFCRGAGDFWERVDFVEQRYFVKRLRRVVRGIHQMFVFRWVLGLAVLAGVMGGG